MSLLISLLYVQNEQLLSLFCLLSVSMDTAPYSESILHIYQYPRCLFIIVNFLIILYRHFQLLIYKIITDSILRILILFNHVHLFIIAEFPNILIYICLSFFNVDLFFCFVVPILATVL